MKNKIRNERNEIATPNENYFVRFGRRFEFHSSRIHFSFSSVPIERNRCGNRCNIFAFFVNFFDENRLQQRQLNSCGNFRLPPKWFQEWSRQMQTQWEIPFSLLSCRYHSYSAVRRRERAIDSACDDDQWNRHTQEHTELKRINFRITVICESESVFIETVRGSVLIDIDFRFLHWNRIWHKCDRV